MTAVAREAQRSTAERKALVELRGLKVAYGDVVVCRNGGPTPYDAEAARAVTESAEFTVTIDLGIGAAGGEMMTCDLTHGYIDENKRTS